MVGGVVICVDCLDTLDARLIETLRRIKDGAAAPMMTKARGLKWYTPLPDATPPHFNPPPHAEPLLNYVDRRTYFDAQGHPLLP